MKKSKDKTKRRIEELLIDPDVRLYDAYAAGASYETTAQMVSEFLDNSIDAVKREKVEVKIVLDHDRKSMIISDDGKGLSSKEELRTALILGALGKTSSTATLGIYGVGAKIAAAKLAKVLIVRSTSEGCDVWHRGCINRKKLKERKRWVADYSFTRKRDKGQHGTVVELRGMKRSLPTPRSLAKDLSVTYAVFLRVGTLQVRVQEIRGKRKSRAVFCKAPQIPVIERMRWQVPRTKPLRGKYGVAVHGWVGVTDQIVRGTKEYGFTLLWRNKVFSKADMIGIEGLQFKEQKFIVGEWHFIGVPVGSEKFRFDKGVREYREVKRLIAGFLKSKKVVQRTRSVIRSKEHVLMRRKIDLVRLNKAIRKFLQKAKVLGDIENLKSPILERHSQGDVEQDRGFGKRVRRGDSRMRKPSGGKFTRVRNPREVMGRRHAVLCRAGGKRIYIFHELDFSKGPYDSPKEVRQNGKGIEVLVNMNHSTIQKHPDVTAVIEFFIAEAVAEQLTESKVGAERRDELFRENI